MTVLTLIKAVEGELYHHCIFSQIQTRFFVNPSPTLELEMGFQNSLYGYGPLVWYFKNRSNAPPTIGIVYYLYILGQDSAYYTSQTRAAS
jgi:hypothetical protein